MNSNNNKIRFVFFKKITLFSIYGSARGKISFFFKK